jgi:hypothetical protein
MYDLTITYPGGVIGAVEVTAAADRQQLELWKLVGGQGKRWIEPGLAGGWIVRILPSTRAKNLLRQLPDLCTAWSAPASMTSAVTRPPQTSRARSPAG